MLRVINLATMRLFELMTDVTWRNQFSSRRFENIIIIIDYRATHYIKKKVAFISSA
jgi:hypothetical protein